MAESQDARLAELVTYLGGGSDPLANRKTTAETPSGAWGFWTFVNGQAKGLSPSPRRTPATPNERWICGLPVRRTPHTDTWARCSLRHRGAPDWDARSRCSAVARGPRREAERSSTGALLCSAHGEIATVEVLAVECGNRAVGTFL